MRSSFQRQHIHDKADMMIQYFMFDVLKNRRNIMLEDEWRKKWSDNEKIFR